MLWSLLRTNDLTEADLLDLLHHRVLQEWPEEFKINEQLMMLKKGTSSKVSVSEFA